MGKMFSIIAVSCLAQLALANQVILDGQQSIYKTLTTASVSHTEYRQEEQQTTCSREVFDGYRQECHWEPGRQVCHYVGGGRECGLTPTGQQCHDLPGHQECSMTPGYQDCHNEPQYRTEYYPCTQTVSVPYTVKDYDLQNDVAVNVDVRSAGGLHLHEVIDLSQVGNNLVLSSIQSSAQVLVFATQQTSDVSNNGSLKRTHTDVFIHFINRQAALGLFSGSVSEITADANSMHLTTSQMSDLSYLKFDLKIKRKKLFKDETLLERTLASNEISIVNSNGQSVLTVDFQKMGLSGNLSGKKIHIDLTISSQVGLESLVNKQDVPAQLSIQKQFDSKM